MVQQNDYWTQGEKVQSWLLAPSLCHWVTCSVIQLPDYKEGTTLLTSQDSSEMYMK